MDKESAIAFSKKYLEDIISFFGLNTEVHVTCDDEVIELSVPSSNLNAFLIGQRGDTLRSLQTVISMALKHRDAEISRVNVDIADYKKQRNERLAAQVREWIEEVRASGEDKHLIPMNAAERRVAHQVASEYSDIATESQGEDQDRHVVLRRVEQ